MPIDCARATVSAGKAFFLSAALFLLIGCFDDSASSPAKEKLPGSVSVRILAAAGSPFKSLARSGDIRVTAADMSTITAPLTIRDSSAEGKVVDIPAGKDRRIEIRIYDSAGIAQYHGADTADIYADSTVAVSIVLVRYSGSAVITGTVSDSLPPSTPLETATRVSLGAQGHPTLGAVLDLDTRMAWTSATTFANQQGIDLVFEYYGGAFHLDNAVSAKAAGVANSINLGVPWSDSLIKDIAIVKVVTKPADQETARSAFAAGTRIKGLAVTAGEILLAESTGGKLCVVTVVSVTGTNATGAADVDVSPLTIP